MQNKIILPETDEKLLDECEVTSFRSSGKGGQHVNTTDSAVRIKHFPTGLVVTCQTDRSQYKNKMECLNKLRRLVKALNYRAPKRIPTKVPRSAKEERHTSKAKQSEKKRLRKASEKDY